MQSFVNSEPARLINQVCINKSGQAPIQTTNDISSIHLSSDSSYGT